MLRTPRARLRIAKCDTSQPKICPKTGSARGPNFSLAPRARTLIPVIRPPPCSLQVIAVSERALKEHDKASRKMPPVLANDKATVSRDGAGATGGPARANPFAKFECKPGETASRNGERAAVRAGPRLFGVFRKHENRDGVGATGRPARENQLARHAFKPDGPLPPGDGNGDGVPRQRRRHSARVSR